MVRPPVSVIIANFNGAQMLPLCVRSLQAGQAAETEIIVVDNGSTDESVAIARVIRPDIRVVQLPTNMGFSVAVNAGIRLASADLLLLLNNDAMLEEGCFDALLTAAGRHPDAAAFAPKILSRPSGELYAAGLMYSDKGYGNRSQRLDFANITDDCDVFGFCGAAALLKREAVRRVGDFNEAFFFLHEDVELSLRLRLAGYRCKYIPAAVVRHVGGATLKNHFPRAVTETVKNSLYTVLSCAPRPYLRRNWRRVIAFHIRLWRFAALQGFSVDVMRGLVWLLTHVSHVWRRRQLIQRTVVITHESLDQQLYRGPIVVNLPGGREVIS